MKTAAKIIIIVMVIAFGMQSTAMAEWKFKSPGEIAKNLGTKAAKNKKVQDAAKEKLTGEDDEKEKKADGEDGEDKTDTDKNDK